MHRGGENPQKAAEFLPRAGPGGVPCSPSRCFPRDPSRGEARAPERREEEGWASGELAADAGFPAAGFPQSRVLFDPELPRAAPRFSAPFSLPGGCTEKGELRTWGEKNHQPEFFLAIGLEPTPLGCRGVWLCFLLPFASQMGHLASQRVFTEQKPRLEAGRSGVLAFFPSVLQGILPRIVPRVCLVKNPQAGLRFASCCSPRGFLFLAAVQHPAAHRPVPAGPDGARGTRASDSSHPKGLGALEERGRSAWSRKGHILPSEPAGLSTRCWCGCSRDGEHPGATSTHPAVRLL